MEEEPTLDFQALRARFQQEELPISPHLTAHKPTLPEKPKVIPLPQSPPPQSPTPQSPTPQSPPHYLPAGARPSLITSINQNLDSNTPFAPRVVFKDDKKESKKPLIHTTSKSKEKNEGKVKRGKDKPMKGRKENLPEDSMDEKKENGKDKKFALTLPRAQREKTTEQVPVELPPKTAKKKGFHGFRKTPKRNSKAITADDILHHISSDVPGQTPLSPVPSEHENPPPESEYAVPKTLLSKSPSLPDSSAAEEPTSPFNIPTCDFIPPPPIVPDILNPEISSPARETPLEIKNPALQVSKPAIQNEVLLNPPTVTVPNPPPNFAPVDSVPASLRPEITAKGGIEGVKIPAVEKPPAADLGDRSISPSPKPDRSISALSALERAEDMNPGKKTLSGDQRIFSALEKARKKATSPLNPARTYSITPPPEEPSPPPSPTQAHPDLPPTNYKAQKGEALPQKPVQVNGINHMGPSPVLAGHFSGGAGAPTEVQVVSDPAEKPARPRSQEISLPHEFSEDDNTDNPDFDDVALDTLVPELQIAEEHEEYMGPDIPDGQIAQEGYDDGISAPETEIHPEPAHDDQEVAEPQAEGSNNIHQSTENLYEDVTPHAGKKKDKTEKKRKGQPLNPYVEAPETNQEKTKTGKLSKSEKKAAAEGPDEKELKKKEKQRQEKEKKELKEKQEREKKEQKEKEKRENELKKKFKITGQEDSMYEATVKVASKGRKNDLPVKTGDVVNIIRMTNCPKGKWLARDSSNNYGYVSLNNVDLDIKEMLEMGRKTLSKSNSDLDGEGAAAGSRDSNHYPLSAGSFTDDDEWSCDEEHHSPDHDSTDALTGHNRTFSMPDMGNKDLNVVHQYSQSDISADGSNSQIRHEARHRLSTFFKPQQPTTSANEAETRSAAGPVIVMEDVVQIPEPKSKEEMDLILLPPPDFADVVEE
ncbi:uncharacterized protein KZ484_006673 [Pholidichthys leucotaenia]